MAYGVTHWVQRISPEEDLRFQGLTIPAGTLVGMTSILLYDDPAGYP